MSNDTNTNTTTPKLRRSDFAGMSHADIKKLYPESDAVPHVGSGTYGSFVLKAYQLGGWQRSFRKADAEIEKVDNRPEHERELEGLKIWRQCQVEAAAKYRAYAQDILPEVHELMDQLGFEVYPQDREPCVKDGAMPCGRTYLDGCEGCGAFGCDAHGLQARANWDATH